MEAVINHGTVTEQDNNFKEVGRDWMTVEVAWERSENPFPCHPLMCG